MANTDDWIIQRAARSGPGSRGEDDYRAWPGYSRPMTADEAMRALAECEHDFRAHRLRLEEKLAAELIARVRSKVRQDDARDRRDDDRSTD
jgi:hypothetical protein